MYAATGDLCFAPSRPPGPSSRPIAIATATTQSAATTHALLLSFTAALCAAFARPATAGCREPTPSVDLRSARRTRATTRRRQRVAPAGAVRVLGLARRPFGRCELALDVVHEPLVQLEEPAQEAEDELEVLATMRQLLCRGSARLEAGAQIAEVVP